MEPQNTEFGTELVLDNRRLILGFVLLVVLCGACFVIGFMEGKRQAIQAKIEAMAPASVLPAPGSAAASSAAKGPDAPTESAPAKDPAVRDQLDWYKSVQRGDVDTGKPAATKDIAAPPAKTPPAAAPTNQAAQNASPVPAVPVPAAKINYSVQVGAFRQLHEAEAKASALKSKGFECAIEPPKLPNQLYLVKVGKFSLRADAVVMQRKLAKAGFTCFIKTN